MLDLDLSELGIEMENLRSRKMMEGSNLSWTALVTGPHDESLNAKC